MSNIDLYQAFLSHTAGRTIFTRRMAIIMADFFDVTPRRVIQQLERLWILPYGSWDWFVTNGGITSDHIYEARSTRPTGGSDATRS